MTRNRIIFIGLLILSVLALFLELRFGKYDLSFLQFKDYLFGENKVTEFGIIMDSRVLRSYTAMISGAGLALSGLLMQTYFRNALAGPSVLGISSGAGLAVAIVLMLSGTGLSINSGYFDSGVLASIGAIIGAGSVLLLISFLSRFLKSSISLLILGLMISYLTSALIGVLQFNASEVNLKAFVVWGLGSFSDTSTLSVAIMGVTLLLGLFLTAFIFKHLNILLLGESYARSMGVPVKKIKFLMIIITGILVGIITAFCGPISFLGLAVPHLARAIFKSSDHKVILPAVIVIGVFLGLFCDLISRAPFYDGGLPLNTVTSLIGAPIVIYYLLRRSKAGEFV